MSIIVLGQHVSILIESSSDPSKKIDRYVAMFGIPQRILNIGKLGSVFLEGPEDGSIRIETCCPNTVINIIKVCCV